MSRKAKWDVEAARVMWAAGAGDKQIAEFYAVSTNAVRDYRKRNWEPSRARNDAVGVGPIMDPDGEETAERTMERADEKVEQTEGPEFYSNAWADAAQVEERPESETIKEMKFRRLADQMCFWSATLEDLSERLRDDEDARRVAQRLADGLEKIWKEMLAE